MSSSEDERYLGRRYNRVSNKGKRNVHKNKPKKDASIIRSTQDRRHAKTKKITKGPPHITSKRLTNKSGFLAGVLSTGVLSKGRQQRSSRKEPEFDLNRLLKAKGKRSTRREHTLTKSITPSELAGSSHDQDFSPNVRRVWPDDDFYKKLKNDASFESQDVLSSEGQNDDLMGELENSRALSQERQPTVQLRIKENIPAAIQHIKSVHETQVPFKELDRDQLNSTCLVQDVSKNFNEQPKVQKNTENPTFHTYHEFALGCIKLVDLFSKKSLPTEYDPTDVERELCAVYEEMHKPKVLQDIKSDKEKDNPGCKLVEHIDHVNSQQCRKAVSPLTAKHETAMKSYQPTNEANKKIEDKVENQWPCQENPQEFLRFKEKSIQLWVNAVRENTSTSNRNTGEETINQKITANQKGKIKRDARPLYHASFLRTSKDKHTNNFERDPERGFSQPMRIQHESNLPVWTQPCENLFSTVLDPMKIISPVFQNLAQNRHEEISFNEELCSANPEQKWAIDTFENSTFHKSFEKDYFKFQNELTVKHRDDRKFGIGVSLPKDCKEHQIRQSSQSWLASLIGLKSPQPVNLPIKASLNSEYSAMEPQNWRSEDKTSTRDLNSATGEWMKNTSWNFFPKLFGRQ